MNSPYLLLSRWLCGLALLLAAAISSAQSQNADPSAVMRIAIDDVITTMRANESLYTKNPQQLCDIIEKSLLPYLSIKHMAKLAIGKNWKDTSSQQQEVIVREFKTYLLHSYIKTLYQYRYVKPEIISREDSGSDKALLNVSVKNERGNTVALSLRLEKNEGSWQILDISAEGISLIVTARGLFNDEITKKGMDGFIQSLIEQNKKVNFNEND